MKTHKRDKILLLSIEYKNKIFKLQKQAILVPLNVWIGPISCKEIKLCNPICAQSGNSDLAWLKLEGHFDSANPCHREMRILQICSIEKERWMKTCALFLPTAECSLMHNSQKRNQLSARECGFFICHHDHHSLELHQPTIFRIASAKSLGIITCIEAPGLQTQGSCYNLFCMALMMCKCCLQ